MTTASASIIQVDIRRGVSYDDALALQLDAVESMKRDPDAPARLFLIEHTPVVTRGRSAADGTLRASPDVLAARGVQFRETRRGGDVTYHGPGQWTLYPILRLDPFCKDLHRYMRKLEEVAIRFLAAYGLAGERRPGKTGVWVSCSDGVPEKIAALGVAVTRWISYHGLAVNVRPDLDAFRDFMIPCGIDPSEGGVTSLAALGADDDMGHAADNLLEAFFAVFPFDRFPPPSGERQDGGGREKSSGTRPHAESFLTNRPPPGPLPEGEGGRPVFPPWLKRRLPAATPVRVTACIDDLRLDTVCKSAHCPNRGECFERGTATFLLMGPSCTRHCRFCAVPHESPAPLDPTEPARVAEAVKRLGLRHAVVTSVTRDDLPDGGAAHFAATVAAIRAAMPGTTVEILTPDFRGNRDAWAVAADAGADVFNHNVETVPRLYPRVRPEADYESSLDLLEYVKARRPEATTKSGLMVGLGETREEILAVGRDLRAHGVELLTVGQYLRPGPANLPVERFVPPEEFEALEKDLSALGFRHVAAAPFVRSSYHAEAAFAEAKGRNTAARKK